MTVISSIRRRLSSPQPTFLKLSLGEERAKFLDLSQNCNKYLDEGFGEIKGSDWSMSAAHEPVNEGRNRYSNIFPFDKNRVILPIIAGAPTDYINASWIRMDDTFQYIATQGPIPDTIAHFWAMAFHEARQQNTNDIIIAMMTPLVEQKKEKCTKYWPTEEDPVWDFSEQLHKDGIQPGQLKITWLRLEVLHDEDFIVTEFELASPSESKLVHHYYFRKWEDAKVPSSMEPLIALSQEINRLKTKLPSLVPIIHCSAGVGRTGTFIATDYLLNADPFNDQLDDPVESIVRKLRKDRMLMVQTDHQYMFLYRVARRLFKEKVRGNHPLDIVVDE